MIVGTSQRRTTTTYSRISSISTKITAYGTPAAKKRRLTVVEDEDDSHVSKHEYDSIAYHNAKGNITTSSITTIAIQDTKSSTTTTTTTTNSEIPKSKNFSFFTRRKPLIVLSSTKKTNISNVQVINCTERTKDTEIKTKPPQPTLKQMQIDFDGLGAPRVTCKECHMQYTPSLPEDAQVHKSFHAKVVGGVNFGLTVPPHEKVWISQGIADDKSYKKRLVQSGLQKLFAPKSKSEKVDLEDVSFGYVVEISRRSTAVEKKKAIEVLRHVEEELSAVPIPENSVWSSVKTKNMQTEKVETAVDKFKIYLYIIGKKCIGFCLAERIKQAHCVEDTTTTDDKAMLTSSSISISSPAQLALIGVSRIWTCAAYRRKGIASRLVECATQNFIYGVHVDRNLVAFSQPTETGGYFARSWSMTATTTTTDVVEGHGKVDDDDVVKCKVGDDAQLQKGKKRSLLVYLEE